MKKNVWFVALTVIALACALILGACPTEDTKDDKENSFDYSAWVGTWKPVKAYYTTDQGVSQAGYYTKEQLQGAAEDPRFAWELKIESSGAFSFKGNVPIEGMGNLEASGKLDTDAEEPGFFFLAVSSGNFVATNGEKTPIPKETLDSFNGQNLSNEIAANGEWTMTGFEMFTQVVWKK